MLETVSIAIQGRWGYYALDREGFLKLKEFHKLLFKDRRATARHERWSAKLPHNRLHRCRASSSIPPRTVPIPEPKCYGTQQRYYMWVLESYRKLRRPASNPEGVPVVDLPKDWPMVMEALEKFYAAP
jgi:hypothetical protein